MTPPLARRGRFGTALVLVALATGFAGTEGRAQSEKKLSFGDRSVILLRMDFGDAPGEPIKRTDAEALVTRANEFFALNSGGKFKLVPTVGPVVRMPKYKGYYKDKPVKEFITDGDEAARRIGLHPENYDFEVMASVAVGFRPRTEGLPGGKGVAMNGDFFWRGMTQELISNMGITSTDLWQPKGDKILGDGTLVPYGDTWDFMGALEAPPNNSYLTSAARYRLGWLGPDEYVTADKSGTFRVAAAGTSGKIKALRVPTAGGTDYWFEYRRRDDNPFSQDGALVYRLKNGSSSPQLLLGNPKEFQEHGADAAPVPTGYPLVDGNTYMTIMKAGPQEAEIAVGVGPFPENHAPTVDIGADKWEGDVGTPLVMAALGADEDGDALAYRWDFGDGTTANNQQKVTHAWKEPGTFTVKVHVTDTRGGEAEHTGEFTINGAAPAPPEGGATDPAAPAAPKPGGQ